MRTKLFSIAAAMVLAFPAVPAMAQSAQDDETPKDARNEGYSREGGSGVSSIALAPAGTAGTWIMCVILGGLVVGVMAKNGKRTHLD